MKKTALLWASALLCVLSQTAFALDPSSAIKSTLVLKTTQSWDGSPITYPTGTAEVSGMVIEIAPGAETGWHQHPVASFALILEGELEVQLKNGKTNKVKAGEALAEVVNTLHNGKNTGTIPTKLVVFYTGAPNQILSVPQASQ